MVNLNAEQLDIVRRLAEVVARDANRALQDARLATKVEVQQAKVGFCLVFHPYLAREAQQQATAITDAVLESALNRMFGRLN
jgi:hypothetical protein